MDGNQALVYLKSIGSDPEEIPGIIFLDINMPVMDGFTFLEKFNNLPDPIREKTKIVMLSSSLDSRDVEKTMANAHVVEFISKPLSEEKVRGLLS